MYFRITKTALIIFSLLVSHSFAATKSIMLLGQTGAGKSTALNALYNAAKYQSTPQNSPDTLRFIVPLNSNDEDDYTPEENRYMTTSREVVRKVYAEVSAPYKEAQHAGRSDTRELVGYQFIPNIPSWSAQDKLELLDTPGIDDTASTDYDNNSIHIQIINMIEEHIKNNSDSISAVVLVVNGSLNRLHKSTQQALNAIRDALPPEAVDRFFILVNRIEENHRIANKLPRILNTTLCHADAEAQYQSIPESHYYKMQPIYLASFNQYLDDDDPLDPSEYQSSREFTERNIRELLTTVGSYTTPIAFKGYPDFIKHKKKLAENIYKAVKNQFKIDATIAEQKVIEEKLGIQGNLCKLLDEFKIYEERTTVKEFEVENEELVLKGKKKQTQVIPIQQQFVREINNDAGPEFVGDLAVSGAASVANPAVGIAGAVYSLGKFMFGNQPKFGTYTKTVDHNIEFEVDDYQKEKVKRTQHIETTEHVEVQDQNLEYQQKRQEAHSTQSAFEKSIAQAQQDIRQVAAQNEQYLHAAQTALDSVLATQYGQQNLDSSTKALTQKISEIINLHFPDLLQDRSKVEQVHQYIQHFCQQLHW